MNFDAESRNRGEKRGEEMGGIRRGRAGIEDLHCWNGGFESAESAEIKTVVV